MWHELDVDAGQGEWVRRLAVCELSSPMETPTAPLPPTVEIEAEEFGAEAGRTSGWGGLKVVAMLLVPELAVFFTWLLGVRHGAWPLCAWIPGVPGEWWMMFAGFSTLIVAASGVGAIAVLSPVPAIRAAGVAMFVATTATLNSSYSSRDVFAYASLMSVLPAVLAAGAALLAGSVARPVSRAWRSCSAAGGVMAISVAGLMSPTVPAATYLYVEQQQSAAYTIENGPECSTENYSTATTDAGGTLGSGTGGSGTLGRDPGISGTDAGGGIDGTWMSVSSICSPRAQQMLAALAEDRCYGRHEAFALLALLQGPQGATSQESRRDAQVFLTAAWSVGADTIGNGFCVETANSTRTFSTAAGGGDVMFLATSDS